MVPDVFSAFSFFDVFSQNFQLAIAFCLYPRFLSSRFPVPPHRLLILFTNLRFLIFPALQKFFFPPFSQIPPKRKRTLFEFILEG